MERCRLCAEAKSLAHIAILKDTRFLFMLEYLFQLKVTLEDKLPTTVCQECYHLVERTWQFKLEVDKAQIVLGQLVNTEPPLLDAAVIENNGVTEIPMYKEDYTGQEVEQVKEKIPQGEVIQNEQPGQSKVKKSGKNSSKKGKKAGNSKKSKSAQAETFKEIEYINPDGSIVPKQGISGWDSYPWTCCECNNVSLLAEELREHFAHIHNIISVRYPCVDCPKVYTKYSSFVGHVKFHRPHLRYSCDICYKWYATSKEVEEHQTTHYEADPFQCGTCGKKFRAQSLLMIHSRSHLPDDLKNCYSCDQCPKKFGTKPNLLTHKRIHLGVKEYTCDQCGKSFVQKGNLDNHLLTHNTARPYSCTVCGKSFKSLTRLRKHSSIHSGLKPHHCDICGRQFRERGTLKEHHRIHTGVMPFTCEFCGKSFRFKGVLTTHRRQHTGERPYSCTECQHHFTNWPNYNKHMKRRHGINTSVNCRTKQDIPPTGKPHRNPPGTVLAPPQPPVQVICQNSAATMETYAEAPTVAFYPVLGLYGIPEEIKGVI